MLEEIQVLALKNGIFLYYSSFASQTIMRELHIFLYLHLYFSNSSLVEFKEEGKACPFLGPRGVIEGKRKKQTVFKHEVRFFPLWASAGGFCPAGYVGLWRHLDSCSKVTKESSHIASYRFGSSAGTRQRQSWGLGFLKEQLSGIGGCNRLPCWSKAILPVPKAGGTLRESGPLAGGQMETGNRVSWVCSWEWSESQDGREQTVPSTIMPHHPHPK